MNKISQTHNEIIEIISNELELHSNKNIIKNQAHRQTSMRCFVRFLKYNNLKYFNHDVFFDIYI